MTSELADAIRSCTDNGQITYNVQEVEDALSDIHPAELAKLVRSIQNAHEDTFVGQVGMHPDLHQRFIIAAKRCEENEKDSNIEYRYYGQNETVTEFPDNYGENQ